MEVKIGHSRETATSFEVDESWILTDLGYRMLEKGLEDVLGAGEGRWQAQGRSTFDFSVVSDRLGELDEVDA